MEAGCHHRHPLPGAQKVDQVHGGGAVVQEQQVAVPDQSLRRPGDIPLALRMLLGTAAEEGHLLPGAGTDTAVDLLRRSGIHKIRHVRTDRIHADAEMGAQLLHGDALPPGDQSLHLFPAFFLHKFLPRARVRISLGLS